MTVALLVLAVALAVSGLRTLFDAARLRRMTRDMADYRQSMGDF